MKFVDKMLTDGEYVILSAKKTWLRFIGDSIRYIFLYIVFLIPSVVIITAFLNYIPNKEQSYIYVLLTAGVLLLWQIFKDIMAYNSVELAITNKRVIGRIGFIKRKILDCPLNKIQNVSVTEPIFGRIFNYGTICVQTAGSGVQISFQSIKKAMSVKNSIFAQMEKFDDERIMKQAIALGNGLNYNNKMLNSSYDNNQISYDQKK